MGTILRELGLAQREVEKALAGKPTTPALIAETVLKASVAHELPTRQWLHLEGWAMRKFAQPGTSTIADDIGR